MLTGMLIWGGTYLAATCAITVLSTPAHRLPSYLLFELVCLAPWTVWLFIRSARRGGAVAIGAVVQAATVAALTYVVEAECTYAGYWEFFQDRDVLCGVRLSGVPIEEFLFFPLAINFALLLYLWIVDYLRSHRIRDFKVPTPVLFAVLGGLSAVFAGLAVWTWLQRDPAAAPVVRAWDSFGIPRLSGGPRGYGWTLIILSSVSVNFLVFLLAERFTALVLRAAIVLAGVFFLVNFLVEFFGTGRGWWVYNARQVSGAWVIAVPVENLAAYLTGITLSLALFEGTRTLLGEKGPP